jgi:hypothetical protein
MAAESVELLRLYLDAVRSRDVDTIRSVTSLYLRAGWYLI